MIRLATASRLKPRPRSTVEECVCSRMQPCAPQCCTVYLAPHM